MAPHPKGWSVWTHREKGGEYTALAVCNGTGPDNGVEFVYYLGPDKATGCLQTFVRRLDDWEKVMVPHPTVESEYNKRIRELRGPEPEALDDFDLEL